MATYNGKKYLKGQLDSIFHQELPPDIVIFRDDVSTDGTVDFLKQYISNNQLENWFIRQNEKNIGWRKNFRQLLIDAQEFEADILFFSDQDDRWQIDKNKQQVGILEKNPQIDVLTGDMEIIKMQQEVTENHYMDFSDSEQLLSQYPIKTTYKSFRPGWTMAMRNQFVKEVLAFWSEDIEVNHDALLEGIACLLGTGYNLNRNVGQHLRHERNASGRPIISLHSTKQEHIIALYNYMGFYKIIYQLLTTRGVKNVEIIKKEYEFYVRRYKAAKSQKKKVIFHQIVADWKDYESMSGRARDIIFAFKK